MLKQRIITASILAPLVLCGVFLLPVKGFAVFFAGVTLIGAWEWALLSDIKAAIKRIAFSVVVLMSILLGWQLHLEEVQDFVLIPALALWCLAFFWTIRYPSEGLWKYSSVRALCGILMLAAAWLSMLGLKSLESGNAWLLLILLIVWAADIGAYFSGKRWGKVKLAPQVSPGKTREGMYGGLVAVALTTIVFAWWNGLGIASSAFLLVLGLVVGLVSVMGDLFESLLKRHSKVKDSGAILPGHGGILDRIDSVLAAAPFYFLGLTFLPIL
ncbi:phosphatidate cytidylyltransferase [Neptunomonas japonica]|uniref:Phosphatidate cytidylyltransferase n=1 Tax=Neptunomonas japonica JAMM 1380 TaxID=1441457 RepID=A0A7R6P787_9GAMM|nr:phosphatidate cytidylyltransferase [Neptunomonas japonica]BBB28534.1 phosphatidate cytidylyltransferase [Neptunomonas japonica JAMM 1380]